MRFKEFSGEWEKCKIKEILKIKSGKDQKKIEKSNGKYFIYGTGGIIGKTDTFLYDKESVGIGRKGTIDKPVYFNKPFWTVDTLFYSEINKNYYVKFVYYLFETINWKMYDESTGVPSLSSSTIESIGVYITNKEEQQKIATFLTLIDKRIETQMKIIEEYKSLIKGIRERILSKNDLFMEITIKEAVNKKLIRVIKPNELSYFEGQKKYLSTSSINENGIEKMECYITYDNRPSRASMKPIKNSVWFAKMKNSIKVFHSTENDEHEYILSTGFYGILCLSSIISPFWLEQIFKSDYFNNQKDKFSEGSSMSGVKDNQFSDLKIKIFKNNAYEQKYIKILNLLDQYIKNLSRILKLLYQEKECLLSNLFI